MLTMNKQEKAKYGTTLADYKRNMNTITAQYNDARIVTFVPPAISGMVCSADLNISFWIKETELRRNYTAKHKRL